MSHWYEFFFKLNIFSVGGVKATKNLSCGDHFIIKGCSMVTFWKIELGALSYLEPKWRLPGNSSINISGTSFIHFGSLFLNFSNTTSWYKTFHFEGDLYYLWRFPSNITNMQILNFWRIYLAEIISLFLLFLFFYLHIKLLGGLNKNSNIHLLKLSWSAQHSSELSSRQVLNYFNHTNNVP